MRKRAFLLKLQQKNSQILQQLMPSARLRRGLGEPQEEIYQAAFIQSDIAGASQYFQLMGLQCVNPALLKPDIRSHLLLNTHSALLGTQGVKASNIFFAEMTSFNISITPTIVRYLDIHGATVTCQILHNIQGISCSSDYIHSPMVIISNTFI